MIGIAAEVRMSKIEQARISSISVMPAAAPTRPTRTARLRRNVRKPPGCMCVRLMELKSFAITLDYYCTCTVASLVTSGIGFCCESFAFTCTMDKFEFPGAIAFTTMPMIVPVPLTPAVFG
jgi:hypothetical protein